MEKNPFTDEELTAMAMADNPDRPLGKDVVPMSVYLAGLSGSLVSQLPEWYMPPVMARGGKWRVPVVLAIVGAFLVIEALGLCSTYGQLL